MPGARLAHLDLRRPIESFMNHGGGSGRAALRKRRLAVEQTLLPRPQGRRRRCSADVHRHETGLRPGEQVCKDAAVAAPGNRSRGSLHPRRPVGGRAARDGRHVDVAAGRAEVAHEAADEGYRTPVGRYARVGDLVSVVRRREQHLGDTRAAEPVELCRPPVRVAVPRRRDPDEAAVRRQIVLIDEEVGRRDEGQAIAVERRDALLEGRLDVSGHRRAGLGCAHFLSSALDRQHEETTVVAVAQSLDGAVEGREPVHAGPLPPDRVERTGMGARHSQREGQALAIRRPRQGGRPALFARATRKDDLDIFAAIDAPEAKLTNDRVGARGGSIALDGGDRRAIRRQRDLHEAVNAAFRLGARRGLGGEAAEGQSQHNRAAQGRRRSARPPRLLVRNDLHGPSNRLFRRPWRDQQRRASPIDRPSGRS